MGAERQTGEANGVRDEATAAFGMMLRRRRRALRLTQEGLAEAAGLSSKFVAHLERAERQPSLLSLLKLGQALGVSASDLVADVERELSRG